MMKYISCLILYCLAVTSSSVDANVMERKRIRATSPKSNLVQIESAKNSYDSMMKKEEESLFMYRSLQTMSMSMSMDMDMTRFLQMSMSMSMPVNLPEVREVTTPVPESVLAPTKTSSSTSSATTTTHCHHGLGCSCCSHRSTSNFFVNVHAR